MRSSRKWLAAVLVALTLGGTAMVLEMNSSPTAQAAPADRRAARNYWRHYDGRWNYWNQADNRWYYTDGSNWYYNDGKAWNVYAFDKDFGRNDFERGDYKAPGADVKVVVPRHKIYVER
jgi:hypothetical protein